jgi:RNA polymerase sigma-70 factor (ECF subfamily)
MASANVYREVSDPLAAAGGQVAVSGLATRQPERATRSARALLRSAQRGTPEALDELVRVHWPDAYRIALGVVGDTAAAEDVAQEAMLAAVKSLDRFDRRRPFAPWLHRVVTNRALDWVRARERRAEVRLGGDSSLARTRPVNDPPEATVPDELSAALSSLDAIERAVVVLRHVLGYSSEEIARMLDKPPATVRSLLRRALERLRERLQGPATRSAEEAANE